MSVAATDGSTPAPLFAPGTGSAPCATPAPRPAKAEEAASMAARRAASTRGSLQGLSPITLSAGRSGRQDTNGSTTPQTALRGRSRVRSCEGRLRRPIRLADGEGHGRQRGEEAHISQAVSAAGTANEMFCGARTDSVGAIRPHAVRLCGQAWRRSWPSTTQKCSVSGAMSAPFGQ
jgi:hypothetical protein